jgi:molybdopterin-guanine dinucleotide biosynthesis protein A
MGGEPKALLDLGGRRIIERVVDAVSAVLADLLVVTNTPDVYAFLGLRMTADAVPGAGSLGGIYSGLRAAEADAIFTVACDMPFLAPDAIRLVVDRGDDADVVIPRVGDQLETLHALYGRRCVAPMAARMAAGRLRITGFFEDVRVVEIPESEIAQVADPAVVFMNVNTPDELARARALVARA